MVARIIKSLPLTSPRLAREPFIIHLRASRVTSRCLESLHSHSDRCAKFRRAFLPHRPAPALASQIDESLQRLQTDRIDLMHFHEIIRLEDPVRILAEGGALEAIQAAQQAGKIRYVGFTFWVKCVASACLKAT